jgi:hypothetical protein
LKIILNFEKLIFEIESFLGTKLDYNFNLSIDSEENCAENFKPILIKFSLTEPYKFSQKNPNNLIDGFFCLETVVKWHKNKSLMKEYITSY